MSFRPRDYLFYDHKKRADRDYRHLPAAPGKREEEKIRKKKKKRQGGRKRER